MSEKREAIIVRTNTGLQGERFEDGQVRVLDLHVAEVLGYARPRDIRELIERHRVVLPDIHERRTVRRSSMPRGGGLREVEVSEFWLTVREALYVAAKSDTPKANVGTLRLIDEYLALQKLVEELLAGQASVVGIAKGMFARLLRPTPEAWRECFEEEFIADLCKLYRQPYEGRGNGRSDPRFLGSVQKKIYEIVVGSEAYREMKRRADEAGVRLHQTLQSDPNAYFRDQLKIVHTIVVQSRDASDFWHRMVRQYQGGGLQLLLPKAVA